MRAAIYKSSTDQAGDADLEALRAVDGPLARIRAAARSGYLFAGLGRDEMARRFRILEIPPMAGAEDDDGDGDGDGDGKEGKVEITKDELDRLKRKAAEGDKAQRKLQAQVDELKESLAEQSTDGDELDKAKAKIERLEGKLEAAEAKATDLEAEIETGRRQRTGLEIAQRLNFRNPARAIKLLDSDDLTDDSSTERALKALANEEPYMVGKRGQRDVTGNDDDAGGNADDDAATGNGSNGNGSGGDDLVGTARARSYYGKQESGKKTD
jgi:hypothetical protein